MTSSLGTLPTKRLAKIVLSTFQTSKRGGRRNKLKKVMKMLMKHSEITINEFSSQARTNSRKLISALQTYGVKRKISKEVFQKLQNEKELLAPLILRLSRLKYLSDKDFVSTLQLYTATLTTPGELKFGTRDVLTDGISDGVEQGLFGLGELRDGQPICKFSKTMCLFFLCVKK